MIDKISRGWYPAGLVRYLMGPGTHEEHVAPRVIASWDGDPDMHQPARVGDSDFAYDPVQLGELIEDMAAPGKAAGLPDRAPGPGEKGSKYGWVWQCSLRNEDSDRVLSDAEWEAVAADVMDRTGIAGSDDAGGCRWIAVRHDDNHIHLMATLVRQDNTRRVHPRNDFHVVRSVCREWEEKLGITLTAGADKTATRAPTRGEIEKATLRGPGPHGPTTGGGGGTAMVVAPPRVRLRQIVSQAAATKRGTPEFLDALRAQGLRVHENHGPDGRLRGYAVGVIGDTDRKGKQVLFGGRTLAPDLSLPKLLQRWDSAPMPEVTLTPTRLSRVSAADEVAALRTGEAAVAQARTALAAGSESVDGIAHATADLITSLARGTDGLDPGAGAVAAEVYDRAARTPGVGQPNQWGQAAQGLRMASWQIGIMGMMAGKGKDQNAATVALLLALGSLVAEIAASHQDAHRVHQAAAAAKTSTLLRTHPIVLAPPPPDLVAGDAPAPATAGSASPPSPAGTHHAPTHTAAADGATAPERTTTMTEPEPPQLHFTRDHLMAMTQLLTMLSQRLAEQRERRGRAAYSNAEHAARTADTHEHPVVRPMTEAERQAFTTQAGDPQVPQHGLNVVTAPVGQEWGVRAVTPDRDAATVMCPNITEAARLADYLRAQNNPGLVNELNELSEQIGHRVATETTSAATPEAAGTPSQQDPSQVNLTKHEGLGDLATNVPTSLTTTPEWERIESQFADLTARGVDPAALAAGVDGLDFDRARRPDALVGWSLDQTAAAWDATHRSTATGGDDSAAVTAEWATQLDPTSPVDRAAAAEAVGRYGPEVDATLAGTFPGLLTAATDARTAGAAGEAGALAQQERERAEALTAESTARTLRGDDVLGGLGSEEDIDREEAAVTQDAEAAEHRGRQSGAASQVEEAREHKVTAQFTPTRSATATATAPRRGTDRTSPTTPTPTQTRARGRSR